MANSNTATLKTKKKIKDALTDLIFEKGFNSITVKDIASRAKINRGTFYLHYTDKYDLLESLEEITISNLNNILLRQPPLLVNNAISFPYDNICEALRYIKSDFSFIKAISTPKGDPRFPLYVKQILLKLQEISLKNSNFLAKSKNIEYSKNILVSSISSVIMLWIEKNGKESPEEVTKIISKIAEIAPQILAF